MTDEHKTTAGELLRQGRLKQRLSIAECAKRTHIAAHYVEALEEGRWKDLPSESHRLGFLRLYSRFLGVSTEEVLGLYQRKNAPPGGAAPASASMQAGAPGAAKKEPGSSPGWSPSSIPQLIGIAIAVLLMAWVVYHAVTPRALEQNPMPWARRRPSSQPRLVVPKSSITLQKVRLKAEADSWLRITSRNQLLFEGILPAGTSKEWSGPGPFLFKISNVRALSLYWNDQPVDILVGARGSVNDIPDPSPMTVANKLTLLRLALVPGFMVFMVFDNLWTRVAALIIFIAAGITDWYDGRIARRTGTVTVIGTFLDPLVDKMLIAAALVGFVEMPELHIRAWMVVLIISREFLITGLRSLAASTGVILAAEGVGKFKMASQITAIITILVILILNSAFENWPQFALNSTDGWPLIFREVLERAPFWLVFATTILTIVSGCLYLMKYSGLLKREFSAVKDRPSR